MGRFNDPTGNCALQESGLETFGFAGGRAGRLGTSWKIFTGF
jgi:catalase (peroxidase I)